MPSASAFSEAKTQQSVEGFLGCIIPGVCLSSPGSSKVPGFGPTAMTFDGLSLFFGHAHKLGKPWDKGYGYIYSAAAGTVFGNNDVCLAFGRAVFF